MICEDCGSKSMYIINSRQLSDFERVRTYVCIDCGKRYESIECMSLTPLEKEGVPKRMFSRKIKKGEYL